MQAIYQFSDWISPYGREAERELREALTLPTALLAGLLWLTLPAPQANLAPLHELMPLEDSHRDLSLDDVVGRFESRLAFINKKDSYKLARLVLELSERHMISPAIILAMIETESSFRYDVVSKSGAVGLMQLLPSTAAYVAKKYHIRSYHSEDDLSNPVVNLRLGVAYLSYLRSKFGQSLHYIAAYNIGPTSLRSRLNRGQYDLGGIETYVRNVHTRTIRLREQHDLGSGSRFQSLLPGLRREAALLAASF